MKKLYLTILVVGIVVAMCFNACSVSKSKNLELTDFDWKVKEFKIVFFQSCVSKSLRNKSLFAGDISYGHDFPLGLNNYRLLDSLSSRIHEIIIEDSISWQNKICPNCSLSDIERMKREGMLGKKTLKYCLEYYNSYELDSIAKKNCEIFLR